MEKKEIINMLWKNAKYAVNSLSTNLIYKTLGEIEMAVRLKAVNVDDAVEIEHFLIRDTLNNPKILHKLHD